MKTGKGIRLPQGGFQAQPAVGGNGLIQLFDNRMHNSALGHHVVR
jgi:hypothetical protein